MAKAKDKDMFVQFMAMGVTMTAADTLTFGHVAVGTSIFDYAAFLIHRVEYKLSRSSYTALSATSDEAHVALCGSNSITDIFDTSNPQIYDLTSWFPIASGTPASMVLEHAPTVHDFSSLPGGGLLVPAQDIYIGMQTAGFAGAGVATCRAYYTIKSLEASDYIELAQRLRVLST